MRGPIITPRLLREFCIAALLSVPLLCLPLIAGDGFYSGFLPQIALVALIGGLTDTAYVLTIRKFLTPVLHPRRIQLRWLLTGPLLVVVLWLAHIPLLVSTAIAVSIGLCISFFIGKSLVWDSLASGVGFGGLYVFLYALLNIPVTGIATVPTPFSSVVLFSRPIEQLMLVFLFGALWGPLCAAFRWIPTSDEVIFHPKHHQGKQLVTVVFLLLLAGCSYWTYDQFVRPPVAVTTSPTDGTLGSLTSPITITFDRPINTQQVLVSVTPEVKGDVSFGDSYLQRNFVRQLTFTPSSHLLPNTTYVLKISRLSNILGQKEVRFNLSFHTPKLPSVASISIQNGQKEVAICDPITIRLDQAPNHLVQFSFQLTPATAVTSLLSSDQKTYTLSPTNCLSQGTTYSLSIKRLLTVYTSSGTLISTNDQPVTLSALTFTTKSPPGISGFSPQGTGVLSNTKQLSISFSEAMTMTDPTASLSLQPPLPGSWSWKDSKTLIYNISSPLQLNTQYTVSINQGLKDLKQGFLVQNTSFSFTTVGHLQVSSISPRGGSGGVTIGTPIRITFDQPVDESSAQANFSISPQTAGTFSWQGQTMQYLAALQKDSSYQISELAGVVSLIGLPLQSNQVSSFQTEESVLSLAIPEYYQQSPLSCEAASLKMALAYRGVSINESTILAKLGDDTTPRQGNIWGDPYQAFVGDVNGHQDTTGYGVYAGPITLVANQYRSAQALSGMSVGDIATNLSEGNPVIFWGTAGNAKSDNWVTPAGRPVIGWIGEHVRLIIGFTGRVSQPSSFIINDPIFGRLHWTASQLRGNMSAFNGMGVAIY